METNFQQLASLLGRLQLMKTVAPLLITNKAGAGIVYDCVAHRYTIGSSIVLWYKRLKFQSSIL